MIQTEPTSEQTLQELAPAECSHVTGGHRGHQHWDPSSPVPPGYEHLLINWDLALVYGMAFG